MPKRGLLCAVRRPESQRTPVPLDRRGCGKGLAVSTGGGGGRVMKLRLMEKEKELRKWEESR